MISFKSIKKSCFFQNVGNSGKICVLMSSRQCDFTFSKKIRNPHLRLPTRAKSRNNVEKTWFWWALDTVISLFHKCLFFVEIVAVPCVLKQKNWNVNVFVFFYKSRRFWKGWADLQTHAKPWWLRDLRTYLWFIGGFSPIGWDPTFGPLIRSEKNLGSIGEKTGIAGCWIHR